MKRLLVLIGFTFSLTVSLSLAGFTAAAWDPASPQRGLPPKVVSNLYARLVTITYHQSAWSNFIPELHRRDDDLHQMIGDRASDSVQGEPLASSIGSYTNQTRLWTNQFLTDITADVNEAALATWNGTSSWTNVSCYIETSVDGGVTSTIDRCVTTDWRLVTAGIQTNLILLTAGDYRGWESYMAQVERERAIAAHPSQYDPRDDFSGSRPAFWRTERDNLAATKSWIRANAPAFLDPTYTTNGAYPYQAWMQTNMWRWGESWKLRPEQVFDWSEDWPSAFKTAGAMEPPMLSDDRLCSILGLPQEVLVVSGTNLQAGVHFYGWQEYEWNGDTNALQSYYSDDGSLVLPVTNSVKTWFDYTATRDLSGFTTGLNQHVQFSWTFDISRARAIDWDHRFEVNDSCLFFDSTWECWSKRIYSPCGSEGSNAWFYLLWEHTNTVPSNFDLEIYRIPDEEWNDLIGDPFYDPGAPIHTAHIGHPTSYTYSASCDRITLAVGSSDFQYTWIGVTQIFAMMTVTRREPEWVEPEYHQELTAGPTSRSYSVSSIVDLFDDCVTETNGSSAPIGEAMMEPSFDFDEVPSLPYGPAPMSRIDWHRFYQYQEGYSFNAPCELNYSQIESIEGSAFNFYLSSLLLVDDLPDDLECTVDLYTQSAPDVQPGIYGDNTAVDQYGLVGWNFALYEQVPDTNETAGCSGDVPFLQSAICEPRASLFTSSTSGIPGIVLGHLATITKPVGQTNVSTRVTPIEPLYDPVTWTRRDYTLPRQTCSMNYYGPFTVHEYEVLARWGYSIDSWYAVCRWDFEYR